MSVLKLNQIQTASGVIMANLNSSGANVGIQLASNLAPAFFAYIGNTQTCAGDTATKIQCNTERFDTNNNYDNATNYRFTPTVAGYYLTTASFYYSSYTAGSFVNLTFYKNGSGYQEVARVTPNVSYGTIGGSCLVYLNGSTDYIELYWYSAGGSSILVAGNGSALSHFDASFVRSA